MSSISSAPALITGFIRPPVKQGVEPFDIGPPQNPSGAEPVSSGDDIPFYGQLGHDAHLAVAPIEAAAEDGQVKDGPPRFVGPPVRVPVGENGDVKPAAPDFLGPPTRLPPLQSNPVDSIAKRIVEGLNSGQSRFQLALPDGLGNVYVLQRGKNISIVSDNKSTVSFLRSHSDELLKTLQGSGVLVKSLSIRYYPRGAAVPPRPVEPSPHQTVTNSGSKVERKLLPSGINILA